MRNLVWGGIETNQVGTAEFVDFCRQVGAEPMICVNFGSEGYANWARTPKGEVRFADADEAAEWVDYCNNPLNRERIAYGFKEPFGVKIWQLGNQMIENAGDHFDYVAFHHMFDPDQGNKNSVVFDNEYRKDPEAAWDILMNGYKIHEQKIFQIREQVAPSGKPLTLTECHYAIRGRNRGEILSSWAEGVSYARVMNVHERHGDLLKIATLADFCGTRWQVNAIMIPVSDGKYCQAGHLPAIINFPVSSWKMFRGIIVHAPGMFCRRLSNNS